MNHSPQATLPAHLIWIASPSAPSNNLLLKTIFPALLPEAEAILPTPLDTALQQAAELPSDLPLACFASSPELLLAFALDPKTESRQLLLVSQVTFRLSQLLELKRRSGRTLANIVPASKLKLRELSQNILPPKEGKPPENHSWYDSQRKSVAANGLDRVYQFAPWIDQCKQQIPSVAAADKSAYASLLSKPDTEAQAISETDLINLFAKLPSSCLQYLTELSIHSNENDVTSLLLETSEQIISNGPINATQLARLWHFESLQWNYTSLIPVFEKALANPIRDKRIFEYAGIAFAATGQIEKSRKLLAHISETSIRPFLEASKACRQSGRFPESFQILEGLTASGSEVNDLERERFTALLLCNDWQQAKQVLERSSFDPWPSLSARCSLSMRFNLPLREEDFTAALEMLNHPRYGKMNTAGRHATLMLHTLRQDWQTAKRFLETCILEEPERRSALITTALFFATIKDPKTENHDYKKYLKQADPSELPPNLLANLAFVAAFSGQESAAINILEQLKTKSPDFLKKRAMSTYDCLAPFALTCEKLGDTTQAQAARSICAKGSGLIQFLTQTFAPIQPSAKDLTVPQLLFKANAET